jgi:predicted deacylase
MARRAPFEIGGVNVAAGTRVMVDLPFVRLYTHSPVNVTVQVIHGNREGPTMFVSGAIHGDELNGIEIIRRLLGHRALKSMRGTLIAVPIVNVLGVMERSRYLPDRRDLNRTFPGNPNGTLASLLSHLFMKEVVSKCDFGIDLHTAAIHRDNLPQVRGDLDNPGTERMALAFGAPVILNSSLVDGSLRAAASGIGVPVLVYEAGEALRFDEVDIRAGVTGVINIMREIGMLRPSKRRKRAVEPVLARNSTWVRSPISGVLRMLVPLGARVKKDEVIGLASSPFGEDETEIVAPFTGIVIGRSNIPLAHKGEALYHIARMASSLEAEGVVEEFRSTHTDDTATLGDQEPGLGDEPPIA